MWLWLTGPQCIRPETDCVFRSGQKVVVVVDRTSVYPARNRLFVQEWSKCGCGGWQDLSVPGQKPTVCSGVVKMWLWWFTGPQCTRPEADPLQQPAGVRQRGVPGLLPGRRAQPPLRLHRPHHRHHQTAHDPAVLHAAVSVSQPVSQSVNQSVSHSVGQLFNQLI